MNDVVRFIQLVAYMVMMFCFGLKFPRNERAVVLAEDARNMDIVAIIEQHSPVRVQIE